MTNIIKNDCQGEGEFWNYHSQLSPFEKQIYKAICLSFQLKDFGHNIIDEIDGECFQQDVEQMNRFDEANRQALSRVMETISPELEHLRSKMMEAVEIIRLLTESASAEANEKGAGGYHLARISDACAFLKEHEDE